MVGCVYILQSQTSGIYYIGSAHDPIKRLGEHNAGKATATRNKGPWIIKFSQQFSSIRQARQVEYKLKKLKRRDYLEQIIKDGYTKFGLENQI